MGKHIKLVSIEKQPDGISARFYNYEQGIYSNRKFTGYNNITEIIQELRKSGVICPKKTYR